MARQSIGSFTITELADGTSPVAAFLSNESHTFAAAFDGTISGNEFGAFTTTLNVFLGDVAIPIDLVNTTDALMANNTFRLAKTAGNNDDRLEFTGSNWPGVGSYTITAQVTPGVSARIDANNITVPDASNSGGLIINVRVKTNNGTIRPFFLVVGYNKQIDGANGDSIQLEPTKQFFLADGAGTFDPVAQDDSIVNIFTQGMPGDLQYFVGQNGGAFTKVTSTSDTTGGISGFTLGRSGAIQTSMYSTDISITSATGLVVGDIVTLTVNGTAYNSTLRLGFTASEIAEAWANEIGIPPSITLTNLNSPGVGFTLTSPNPLTAEQSTDSLTAIFQVSSTDGTIPSDIPGNVQRLFISSNNIGDNDSISLKVTGAMDDQGNASVSFTKVRRGFTGNAALNVVIESSDGDTFIEGTIGTKVLSVVVYDQGTGSLITSGLTYDWRYETSTGLNVAINNETDRLVVVDGTGTPAAVSSIIVDNIDLLNFDRRTYVCVVDTNE